MSDSDLRANIDRIEELADSLHSIYTEFSNAANPIDGVDVATAGHEKVIDVFGSFESNWSVNREKLTGQLEKLAGIAGNAAEAYSEVERHLAEALVESDQAEEATVGQSS